MLKKSLLLAAIVSITLLSACGGGGGGAGAGEGSKEAPSEKKEPVELVFATHLGLSQENFEKEIGEPVRKKFPYIKPKYIERGQGTNLADLVTAGIPPDITWYVHSSFTNTIKSLGLEYDMTELVKKYKYDMNRFYPQVVDTLKYYTDGKGIYGIPRDLSQAVLYYNKDIFDKFGVAYPKDGMSWDDTYEVAKKMTRNMEGVDYRGMSSFYSTLIRENQLSISPLDQKADKADVNTEQWKYFMQTIDKFYKIPGNNRPTNTRSITPEVEQFEKQLNVAMIATGYGRQTNFPPNLNWDIVSLPTFKEKPKIGLQTSPSFYSVTSTSKHKDDAFEVIMFLMSDERMMAQSKAGGLSPVKKTEIQMAFATDAPALKGKNLQAVFVNDFAPMEPARAPGLASTAIRQDAINILNDSLTDMMINSIDVNTALRQAEDKINQKIADFKKQ